MAPKTFEQPGYLFGLGETHPRVGPKLAYHWKAQIGTALPYWSLYNGTQEIGLHVFPIHETQDWPDLLNQMLKGLNNA